MADACVSTTGTLTVEYNTGAGGFGFDFNIVDSDAPAVVFQFLAVDRTMVLFGGGDRILYRNQSTAMLLARNAASGDVARFEQGGTPRVVLNDEGIMEFVGADSGIVLNVLTSDPSSPEEGLCYIFDDSGTYYFRAYINGGWRQSASAYT